MENKEKLTRKIIEAIHGLPYTEAIKKEKQSSFVTQEMVRRETGYFENGKYWEVYPITIGRVMQAFFNNKKELSINIDGSLAIRNGFGGIGAKWKLTKENGQEATLDDQSENTINKLIKLF